MILLLLVSINKLELLFNILKFFYFSFFYFFKMKKSNSSLKDISFVLANFISNSFILYIGNPSSSTTEILLIVFQDTGSISYILSVPSDAYKYQIFYQFNIFLDASPQPSINLLFKGISFSILLKELKFI